MNPQVSSKKLTASWKQVPRRSPPIPPLPTRKHTTWHTDCVLARTTFFPDRYVLRFGELSLWTGHREKFPAALKIEKTPLLLWVSPPTPSLLRSNSTSAGQLNFSSYQLPWRGGGSINKQVLYTPKSYFLICFLASNRISKRDQTQVQGTSSGLWTPHSTIINF